jgi:hypothetical protein
MSLIGPNNVLASTPIMISQDVNSNLVLYLPMDENEGEVAYDLSGNENNGILNGANWIEGFTGYGLSFDGVDDLVTVKNQNILESQNSLTISAWVKIGQNTPLRYFIVSNGFGIFQGQKSIGLAISVPNTNNAQSIINLSSWNFITGTFDGTQISWYVNGSKETQMEWPGTMATNIGRDLVFGYFNSEYWEGSLDEVAIWNRALSDVEIMEIYTDGLEKTLVDEKESDSSTLHFNFIFSILGLLFILIIPLRRKLYLT